MNVGFKYVLYTHKTTKCKNDTCAVNSSLTFSPVCHIYTHTPPEDKSVSNSKRCTYHGGRSQEAATHCM